MINESGINFNLSFQTIKKDKYYPYFDGEPFLIHKFLSYNRKGKFIKRGIKGNAW